MKAIDVKKKKNLIKLATNYLMSKYNSRNKKKYSKIFSFKPNRPIHIVTKDAGSSNEAITDQLFLIQDRTSTKDR